MILFKKKKDNSKSIQNNWKIKRKCFDLIVACAKSNYPNEFGGLLRVDEKDKNTVSELVVLPGTVSGDTHAIFKLYMLPIDFSIVGTVHSHPSYSSMPSDADLHLFQKHGKIHMIIAKPFTYSSWNAYDFNGNNIEMKIV